MVNGILRERKMPFGFRTVVGAFWHEVVPWILPTIPAATIPASV